MELKNKTVLVTLAVFLVVLAIPKFLFLFLYLFLMELERNWKYK